MIYYKPAFKAAMEMNTIDLIVGVILSFYFLKGVLSGFLRTLIGPIALILGTIVAVLYYFQNEVFLNAILISILAPVLISFLFNFILNNIEKSKKDKEPITGLSRLAGGTLALSWASIWIGLLLVFITIAPVKWGWFERIQDQTLGSTSYEFIDTFVGKKIPATTANVHKLTEVLQDPQKFQVLEGTEEYRELIEDKKVRAVLTDRETMRQIEEQNIPRLLVNPRFQALIKDKDLIKKIFALHNKLTELERSGRI